MTKIYLVKTETPTKIVDQRFEKEKNKWTDSDTKSNTFNAVQKEIARIKNQNSYNPLKFMKLSILHLSSSLLNFIPVSDKASTKGQKAILGRLNNIRNDGLMPHKSNLKI